MAFHSECKQLCNIQLTLIEGRDLLESMKKGVKKVNGSVTVFDGLNSVEVTNVDDLALDTLVGDVVKDFTIEVEARDPYKEKVSVNCRSNGKVLIEAMGASEEFVLGKVTLVARYLEARQRRTTVWLRRLARFLLICSILVILECLNWCAMGRQLPRGALRLLRTSPVTGLVLAVAVGAIVGIYSTGLRCWKCALFRDSERA